MSIYTVRPLKTSQRPNPLFRQKGMKDVQPCSLSNSEVRGFPHKRQIAFSAYKSNVDAFLFATQQGVRVLTNAEGFPINIAFDKCVELPPPPVGVAFEKKISNDKKTEYQNDYGAKEVQNRGQTIYIFDTMVPDLAKMLYKDGAIPNARTPTGVATLQGYQAYMMLTKILTLFLYALIMTPSMHKLRCLQYYPHLSSIQDSVRG
jgi:hypothetical protein